MIPTQDPYCFIVEQNIEQERVVYVMPSTGETWEILGTCNGCGECMVGLPYPDLVWTGIPVGQAGACYLSSGAPDERLDMPCRPEIEQNHPGCVLSGRYLNGD